MATVSISAVRANLRSLVQRVQAGEEITLTQHGAPVAVLVRPDRLSMRPEAAALLADARERMARIEALRGKRKRLGLGPGISSERAEQYVRELREERDAE
ncbi:MAG: type II toxin-antitoxin system Phd/YefM family antitoxin [Dehalococcoidia bacterium]